MEFLREFGGLVTAILAVILSGISIFFGVRYNRKTFEYQKNHNKLTTEPHFSLMVTAYNAKGHTITISNNGYGPALIKSIKYFIGNKEYSDIGELYVENYPKLIYQAINEESSQIKFGKNTVFASGESMTILDMKFNDSFDFLKFKLFLTKVKLVLKYRTIYNEENTFEDLLVYNL
jgi:hypothetical protein